MRHFITIFFVLYLVGTAVAAEQPAGNVPTNIHAARMDYNADKQTVTFAGSVHVKRPDFQLWSDKLTVYLEKNAGEAKSSDVEGMQAGRIDRIVASGNVRMKSEDKEGTCGKATYYAAKDLFVMEENPVLRQKDNRIEGQTISHYMKAGRSEVTRPSATFSAPDHTNGGNPLTPPNKDKQ